MQSVSISLPPPAIPNILPADAPLLEASEPAPERDAVRLLISQGHHVTQTAFRHLATAVRPGDLWVVNDSATLPSSLFVDGIEIHLSTCLAGYRRFWFSGRTRWVVEPRHHAGHEGETHVFPDGAVLKLLKSHAGSTRLWEAELDAPIALVEWLGRWGKPIRYRYVPKEHCLEHYQTMFASRLGSAEMPSAGRPFTPRVVADMQARGASFATITLHTGVASGEAHEPPYAEYFEVSPETAAQVQRTRQTGGRVIAVGTTVVRALESAPLGGSGWTHTIISEASGVSAVDGLLTGLHEPQASHLAMLAAFTAPDNLRAAYRIALEAGYRWHEFGDVHLILP